MLTDIIVSIDTKASVLMLARAYLFELVFRVSV